MKKILVPFIFIISIFAFFIGDSEKVKAASATCKYPNCCEYRLKAGLTYEIYVKIEFDSNFNAANAYVTYRGDTNKEATIKNWNSETDNDGLIAKEYMKNTNSCPEDIVFKHYDTLWWRTYDVWIGDTNRLNDISETQDGQMVSVVKPLTEEEISNVDNHLQRLADEIHSQISNIENNRCLESNIYNEDSEEHDLNLIAECKRLTNSLSIFEGSTDVQIDNAKLDGIDDESKYSGLKNLNLAKDEAKKIISSVDSLSSSGGSISFEEIATGEPMDCETLKDSDTYKIIRDIFTWIQIAAPIMLIIFGVLDFGKAIASSDADAMKKAQSTFVKRVIIVAAIILLPFIMDLMFSLLDGIMGNDTCGIGRPKE